MRYSKHRIVILNAAMITIILLIGVTGASYSLWADGIDISGSVSMGNIDVSVTELNIVDDENPENIDVSTDISHDGKQIEISVDNAVPGYSQKIEFAIENKGSIPVEYQLFPLGEKSIVQVIQDDTIIDVDGIDKGSIIITIPDDAEESAEYQFSFELNFQQPIVEKEK